MENSFNFNNKNYVKKDTLLNRASNPYFKSHEKRKKPKEQLVRALNYCQNKNVALDLGAGNFIESKFLLDSNFKKVIAVDYDLEIKKYINKDFDEERFKFVNSTFQEFFDKFSFKKNHFDIINAQNSLPFHGKKDFSKFIDNIKDSLNFGGVFVGQFFGDKDEWNTSDSRWVFLAEKEAKDLLSGLEIIEFIEEKEFSSQSGKGPKNWYIFHFIARKPLK